MNLASDGGVFPAAHVSDVTARPVGDRRLALATEILPLLAGTISFIKGLGGGEGVLRLKREPHLQSRG
jgi:hypothetical protein